MKTKILYLFLLLFFVFSIAKNKELGVDLYHHLKTGELIAKIKSPPYFDVYSYTAYLHPWMDHEWGFQIVVYTVYKLLGASGLFFLKFFLLYLTFSILLFFIYHKNKNISFSFLLTVFVLCASKEFLLLRPQLFTFLFLLTFNIILDKFHRDDINYLPSLPILMLFWVNLHGGFIVGIFLFLIYFITDLFYKKYGKIKNYSIFLIFTLIVTLANPYSYHLYIFIYHNLTSLLLLKNIKEWFSPDFHLLSNYLFEIFILFILFTLSLSYKKIKTVDFLKLIFFLHISLFAVRNIPLFLIIFSPVLGELLLVKSNILERLELYFEEKKLYIVPLLLSIFIIFTFPRGSLEKVLIKENFYPEKAVKFIKMKKLKGNMFNDYNWGGYLIYKLPEYKVFIDGRIVTVYPENVISDYNTVVKLKEGWKEILDKYKVNFILLSTNQPLLRLLKESKEWKLIYSDHLSQIFERVGEKM